MDSSGSLAPGGRFDRIEAALTRIEDKLSSKVTQEQLSPLIRRVELLESGETPLGRVLLEQFNLMQSQLNELLLHGSQNAQLTGKRVGDLEIQVAEVKTTQVAQKHAIEERREDENKRHRIRTFALSAVSTSAGAISVAALFIGLHH